MYAKALGLKHEPFSIAPDPRYLFMSERHREALAHLLYGIKGGGGFVLLTGEIGAGKTTVCRCFLEQVPKKCNVAYIFNPKLTADELVESVCTEFGVQVEPGATGKARVDALNEFLLRTHAVGQNNLLIIDEAQNLALDVLEQLRLLTNLETRERKLLQIVLIGQPELRDMLAKEQMEQLAQRVIARYHLGALSEDEMRHYIRHRLEVAGWGGPLPFERAALARIFKLSRGVPRRINLLCDRALLGAYSQGKRRADDKMVVQAGNEVFGADRRAARRQALAQHAPMLALGAAGLALALGVAYWVGGLGSAVQAVPVAIAASAASGAGGVAAAASGPASPRPAASAVAATPATGTPAPPALIDQAELRANLARNGLAERAAWQGLAGRWGQPSTATDSCADLLSANVRCQKLNLNFGQLRQLDRPAALLLQGEGVSGYALLQGLSAQGATLRLGEQTLKLPLVQLAAWWRGEALTLWRSPEGYAGSMTNGARGPAVKWLAARLAQANQDGGALEPPVFDDALKARVQVFQRLHGLASDGVAGPTTLMQLNRATSVDEPRLLMN